MINISYPDRVQIQENGFYRWNCRIDKSYEQRIYKITMRACGIIAALILVIGLVFAWMVRDLEVFGIIAGCVAVFLLISVGVCVLIDRLSQDPHEIYEMTDSYVKIGTGKYAQYFWYKDIRQTTYDMNYMELKGLVRTRRVYIPAEDMEFVKSYVTAHIAHAKMKESGL